MKLSTRSPKDSAWDYRSEDPLVIQKQINDLLQFLEGKYPHTLKDV